MSEQEQGEDLENKFVCLDVICKEKNCVIVTTEEMFYHLKHKDVICFKDIRSDIDKNAIMVDKFLSDHDLNKYLRYVDEQIQNFSPEYHDEVQEFLDSIKTYKYSNYSSKLTIGFVETQKLQDVFKFIRSNSMAELSKLKGNFFFLKNIQKLPDLSELLDEPFQKAQEEIKQFKIDMDLKIKKGLIQPIQIIALLKNQEKKNGYAKHEFKNGDVYKGEWKDGLMNGEGETISSNGDRFKGNYVNGTKSGYGEQSWSDGDVYKGLCHNDKKHGLGEYKSIDGNTYKGEYVEGEQNGYGEYYWASGQIYKGQYKNNKKHGQGEYFTSDGNRYKGSYLDDKKHGYGEYYQTNGDVYKGQWENGKKKK